MENRRGQGRESSEGQSESEDGGQQLGSRDRDLSRSRGYFAGSGSRSRATFAAKDELAMWTAAAWGAAVWGVSLENQRLKKERGGERSESKRSEG